MREDTIHKPNILICIDHFVPGYKSGGPQKSILNLIDVFKDECNFFVVCLDRDLGDKVPYGGIPSLEWVHYAGYSVLYFRRFNVFSLYSCFDKIYDVVILNSFFAHSSRTTLLLILLNRIKGLRIFLAPRGELFESALTLKWFKKSVFIKITRVFRLNRFFKWIATNEDEKQAILKHFPHFSDIVLASDISVFPSNEASYLEKDFLSLKIVFLSRISEIKNLVFALKILSRVPPGYRIIFDIYGTQQDESYWQQCQQIIAECDTVQVTYQGAIEPEDVPHILSQYHLFFLPTQSENFGHAIVEALSAATIVLISNRTPWHNLEEAQAGWDLPLTSPHSYLEKILFLAEADQRTIDFMRQNALKYAKSLFESNPGVAQSRRLLLEKG